MLYFALAPALAVSLLALAQVANSQVPPTMTHHPVPGFPTATIANSAVSAGFYLPDFERGYYRGTRFDWSGQIYSLKFAGHEYFGQWFAKYDPILHDGILGPVEEFTTGGKGLGWDEAKPGEPFVRIGIGSLRKPTEGTPEFNRFTYYPVIDPGKWIIRPEADRITFIHELNNVTLGYRYVYTKRIRFDGSKPVMLIEHSLRNTGKKPISTDVYNHNFFTMDAKPTGPDASVTLPFEPQATQPFKEDAAGKVDGKRIVFTRELQPGGESAFAIFEGRPSAKDFQLRLEHKGAGAGVEITGDQPISKMVFWAIRSTFCPEPYNELTVAPGKEVKWTLRYRFYELGKSAQ